MSPAVPAGAGRGAGTMSIGQVLRQLREEFSDISISKIRYLEAEGLITPDRAPSGYRQFRAADVDQLRYILSAQRDHYLPLRVIKEHLDAIARGLEPPTAAGEAPRAPRDLGAEASAPDQAPAARADLRLSRAELLANSGLDEEQLHQAEDFGLVNARAGTDQYDATALAIARMVAEMTAFGLEPRHLRAVKTAADRAADLVEQAVLPASRRRDERARDRAAQQLEELAGLATRLHAALVRDALPPVR